MSLSLRGETIISQWIHPSVPPSCPGAPWASPNARTLHPPWDETWPCAPSPHPGASVEPLALTRLTGRWFSLKSNPGERIQSWMDRQIDGWKHGDADTWRSGERAYRGQVEGTRRRLRGQGSASLWRMDPKLDHTWLNVSLAPTGMSGSSKLQIWHRTGAGRGARGTRDCSTHQLLFQCNTQTHFHTWGLLS